MEILKNKDKIMKKRIILMAFLGLFCASNIQAMSFLKSFVSNRFASLISRGQESVQPLEINSEDCEKRANEVLFLRTKQGAAIGAAAGIGATWLVIRNTDDSIPRVLLTAGKYGVTCGLLGSILGFRIGLDQQTELRQLAVTARGYVNLEARLDGVNGRLDGVDGRLDGISTILTEVQGVAAGNGRNLATLTTRLEEVENNNVSRHGETTGTLGAIQEDTRETRAQMNDIHSILRQMGQKSLASNQQGKIMHNFQLLHRTQERFPALERASNQAGASARANLNLPVPTIKIDFCE